MKHKKSHAEDRHEESMDKSAVNEELSYEDKLKHVNQIATPIATRKLAKKLYKLIKKSSQHKNYLRSGFKAVQGHIRKGERGIVILAGDITPIEIICHLPAVCEELHMPYVYTPSRVDLGKAMGVKRSCITVLIKEHEEYKDLYDTCKHQIEKLPFILP